MQSSFSEQTLTKVTSLQQNFAYLSAHQFTISHSWVLGIDCTQYYLRLAFWSFGMFQSW